MAGITPNYGDSAFNFIVRNPGVIRLTWPASRASSFAMVRTAYGGEPTTRFLYDGEALVGGVADVGLPTI